MNICLVGINHRTAPVDILERAAVNSARLRDVLKLLRANVSYGVLLSTCNRTEVCTVPSDGSCARDACLGFLQTRLDTSYTTLLRHTYILDGKAAVESLYRTASGLDSMIIGEYEVLGQVRQALEIAKKVGMVNLPLQHIFSGAIRTGRRVREETGISKNALSVSSVAVDLAAKIIGNLSECKMLVIGAGEAGRLVAKTAGDRGVSQISIASRTQERALNLTGILGGTPVSISKLDKELDTCNIIVTCANAPHCIVEFSQVQAAMRRRPDLPLVIIDIAVPRNVESAITQIKNVFLYNIDDLTQMAEQNRRQRQSEVKKAENIIASELVNFTTWWQDYKIRPLIRAMMGKAEKIRRSHLERTVKNLHPLSEEEYYRLEMMTKSIVAKILKDPIHNLKANGYSNHDYAEIIKELFQLNEGK